MNQDFSAGLGAGLMRLGDMFSTMLMKRMDAKWEDENYQKRLEAANKAEMAKLKALEEYKRQQQAGAVPYLPTSNEGPMQPMMQPVNAMGEAIGAPRGMQPHEQYQFESAQGAARSKAALDELALEGKMKDLEAKDARMAKDKAQAELARKRASGAIGGPRTNGKDYAKDAARAQKDLLALKAELPDDLLKQLDEEEATILPQGGEITDLEKFISYSDLLSKYQDLWQRTPDFRAMRDAKRKKETTD